MNAQQPLIFDLQKMLRLRGGGCGASRISPLASEPFVQAAGLVLFLDHQCKVMIEGSKEQHTIGSLASVRFSSSIQAGSDSSTSTFTERWFRATDMELDEGRGLILARDSDDRRLFVVPGARVRVGTHVHPLNSAACTVVGFDPETGRLHTRVDNSEEEAAPGPVIVALKEVGQMVEDPFVRSSSPAGSNGTQLLLVHDGGLVDTTLEEHLGGARHRLRLSDSSACEVDLNAFNHCAGPLCAAEYEAARVEHCRRLADETQTVEDAITLRVLDTEKQLVSVETVTSEGVQRVEWGAVSSLKELKPLLLLPSDRSRGEHDVQPVLLRAGPGTGKSWSALQLAHTLSLHLESDASSSTLCVPLLIRVQRLARFISAGGDPASYLELYLEHEYMGEESRAHREMLLMAYQLRALIVILDGVDEAPHPI